MDLLPDEKRVMPPTRPDTDAAEHKTFCTCEICRRPHAMQYKRGRQTGRELALDPE